MIIYHVIPTVMPSRGSMAKTGIASNNCYTLIKPFFPSGFFLKGKLPIIVLEIVNSQASCWFHNRFFVCLFFEHCKRLKLAPRITTLGTGHSLSSASQLCIISPSYNQDDAGEHHVLIQLPGEDLHMMKAITDQF